jgi:hypothetical protein
VKRKPTDWSVGIIANVRGDKPRGTIFFTIARIELGAPQRNDNCAVPNIDLHVKIMPVSDHRSVVIALRLGRFITARIVHHDQLQDFILSHLDRLN